MLALCDRTIEGARMSGQYISLIIRVLRYSPALLPQEGRSLARAVIVES